MKPPVRPERITFAREHSRRVFVLALEREHAGGERKTAGHVFAQLPAENLAVVLESWKRDLADLGAGERSRRQCRSQLLVANADDVFVATVGRFRFRPQVEELFRS